MPTPAPDETLEARLRKLGPAPRLFAAGEDWPVLRVRIQKNPTFGAIYRAARARADALLAGPALVHVKEGNRRLGSARLFQGRLLDLATVARVENDSRFAARAREELMILAHMPDWGVEHFLDVAEYALGAAVGLDWLHDFLSERERDVIAHALVERALRPSFNGTPHSLRWVGGRSNWTQVCHAGLAAAALAVADREPKLAARTLERAIADQAGPNAAYAPDGVYPEGPTYWAYGTTFEVILISLLERVFGTDFGLADFPGFLAGADYLRQVTAPSGRYFNYADAREFAPSIAALHWFARKRCEPRLAESGMIRIAGRGSPMDGELEVVYERHDALALWWRGEAGFASTVAKNPRGPEGIDPSRLPLVWLGRGENPVAVFRSAWDDPRARYLAIKGGSPSTSHAHMDAGSFILEADGVRWAVDPGMQDYHGLESAGVKLWDLHQAGDRWNVFRIGPDAHNILRFNSAPQLVAGTATFTEFTPDVSSAAPSGSATLDLAPLYRDHVVFAQRKVSLLADGRFAFEDVWIAGPEAVEVAWQFLTHAELAIEPRGVLLRQAGETLRLRVLAPDAIKIEVEDLSQPVRSFDAPNPGLRRLRVIVQTPAGQSGRLSISAEPGAGRSDP